MAVKTTKIAKEVEVKPEVKPIVIACSAIQKFSATINNKKITAVKDELLELSETEYHFLKNLVVKL